MGTKHTHFSVLRVFKFFSFVTFFGVKLTKIKPMDDTKSEESNTKKERIKVTWRD